MLCKECGDNVVLRQGGLCLRCRLDQLTRLRGLPAPTDAEAGTPEKVAVMAERYARGEQIFHPDDPVFECDGKYIRGHRGLPRDVFDRKAHCWKDDENPAQEDALRNWEDAEGR